MWTFAFAMVLGQVPGPQSPADALAAVHADLRRFPLEQRTSLRYLSLYATPQAERTKLFQVLCGHCNSLSREPGLEKPAYLGTVIRVNLLDYAWDAKTWDEIADPYFTVTVEQNYGWYDRYGRLYKQQAVKERALAPWLAETPEAKHRLAEVVGWTQAKSAVVSAPYFLSLTSAGEDRKPNVYDFLGVKNEKDFLELGAVDVKAAAKVYAINRDAVSVSEITKFDRAIVAVGQIRGEYFKTFDFAKPNAGTALRVLGGDVEKLHDASEQIVTLPNRLLAFGLFNAKGERQDSAPTNIVKTPVQVYRDCIACHERGYRKLDSWIEPQIKGPVLDLKSPDEQRRRELRREYLEGLKELIEDSQARYEKRLKEVTGLSSKDYAAALTEAINKYEGTVDLASTAADLGVSEKTWHAAMEKARVENRLNTVIAPLLIGKKMVRATWESEITNAHAILRGFQ